MSSDYAYYQTAWFLSIKLAYPFLPMFVSSVFSFSFAMIAFSVWADTNAGKDTPLRDRSWSVVVVI